MEDKIKKSYSDIKMAEESKERIHQEKYFRGEKYTKWDFLVGKWGLLHAWELR